MCVHWRMRQVKCCLPSDQRHCKNLVDIINFMQRALYRGLFLWLISFCKPAAIFKKNKMRLSFSIFSALLPFENVKISLSPRWTLEQQQHSLWKQSLCFVNKEKKREKFHWNFVRRDFFLRFEWLITVRHRSREYLCKCMHNY